MICMSTLISTFLCMLLSRSAHVLQIIELERKAAAQGTTTRGSAFSSWANLDIAPEDMYFVDSHGDRNNLVYGGLYRADVAAYHRVDPCGIAKGAMHHGGRHIQRYILPPPPPPPFPPFLSCLFHAFPVQVVCDKKEARIEILAGSLIFYLPRGLLAHVDVLSHVEGRSCPCMTHTCSLYF